MAEEFQSYFYLSHRDLHSPKPGKIVGYLLIVAGIILMVMKLLGLDISWSVIFLVIAIGASSVYIGKVAHHVQKDSKPDPEDFEETEEDQKFAY